MKAKLIIGICMLLIGCMVIGGCGDSPTDQKVSVEDSTVSTDAEVIPYPRNTCLVSKATLNPDDDIVVFVYEGKEVKLCCDGCKQQFDKDPETYMSRLD